MELGPHDHAAVLDAIHDVGSVLDFAEFPGAVLRALHALVPSDGVGYNEVDPTVPKIVYEVDPPGYVPADFASRWEAHAHLHPVLRHFQETGDGSARKISDFLSDAEYRASDLYRNVYSLVPINYQMVVLLPTQQPLIVALVTTRADADFSERDRAALDAIRPHFAQAYRSAQEHSELTSLLRSLAAGNASNRAVVFIGPDGAWAYPDASVEARVERWLHEVEPGTLDRWLESQRYRGDHGSLPGAAAPFAIERDRRRVAVRLVPSRTGPEMLVFEESRRVLDPSRLRALGLSVRESEVMALVAQGMTNAAVGARLGIGTATVRKHLEHVYRRLDVQSRTEAVVAVLDALAGDTG